MKTYDDLTKAEKEKYHAYLMQKYYLYHHSFLYLLFTLGMCLVGMMLISTAYIWLVIGGFWLQAVAVLMLAMGLMKMNKDTKALMLIFNMKELGFFGIEKECGNKWY